MTDEQPNPEQYVVPHAGDPASGAPTPAAVVPAPSTPPAPAPAPSDGDTFRGRPKRSKGRRWTIVVGPLGSGVATLGALFVIAEAPAVLAWSMVGVGVVAAAVSLVVAHR